MERNLAPIIDPDGGSWLTTGRSISQDKEPSQHRFVIFSCHLMRTGFDDDMDSKEDNIIRF